MHNIEKRRRKKRTPLHKDNFLKKCRLQQQKKNTFPDLNFLPLTKSTVDYSDMRERPVSLLSSHPNKHELEPAVYGCVQYGSYCTKPTNPNLTCKTQNVYS